MPRYRVTINVVVDDVYYVTAESKADAEALALTKTRLPIDQWVYSTEVVLVESADTDEEVA
jgi:hypothetical protein